MNLGDMVDESDSKQRTPLRLYTTEYTMDGGSPLIHLLCRAKDGTRYHIEVQNVSPYFHVPSSAIDRGMENHVMVNNVERDTTTSLNGESLGTVSYNDPTDTADLRDQFEQTYEADISYTKRFLIDNQINTSLKVELDNTVETINGRTIEPTYGDYRVTADDITTCNRVEVDPRTVTLDIEVSDSNGFPHPESAEEPVTVVTAYDSYEEAYTVWLLENPQWSTQHREKVRELLDDRSDVASSMLYENESQLLNDLNLWIAETEPDFISGWSSDDYDIPYLINRSANLSTYSYEQWSSIGEVYTTRDGSRATVKGVTLFDMLKGYKKTQIHELKNNRLDTVAKEELGKGKVDFDGSFDELWCNDPAKFVQYNIRDVESVVEIAVQKGVVDTFGHMQEVTGAEVSEMINMNFDMIDTYFLRLADEEGYALPTSTEPEEDWFYGGMVFTPVAGLHTDVVYPDLSSMYPSIMSQTNMSPETLVGTQEELDASEYDESDCVWSYIDTRPVKRVGNKESYDQYKDGTYKAIMRENTDGNYETAWIDDPQDERLYYLSADVKEGFIASGISELLDMKYEYKGTDLYAAVKAVINSSYGVFGDSNTRGTGYRLFDVRMAESVTLAGQTVIKYTDKQFVQRANELKEERNIGGEEAYRVGGDTDSAFSALPFELNESGIINVAEDAAEWVNNDYDTFCEKTFGLEEHAMEVEVESYSPRCFVPMDTTQNDPSVGSKKRYVTLVTVEDGEVLDEHKLNIKGFEAVRSDVADITIDIQEEIFNHLMYDTLDEAKDATYELVREIVGKIQDREIDLMGVGIPSSIGKELDSYGTSNRRPQPPYRGAKYANQYIYEDEFLTAGSKPLRYPVAKISAEYPAVYSSDTAEDGDRVDWLTVEEASDIPEGFVLDTDEIARKTVDGPLKRIFQTLNWDYNEAILQQEQLDLAAYM